jgi:glycerophosphoryl diester phosphodiesterase
MAISVALVLSLVFLFPINGCSRAATDDHSDIGESAHEPETPQIRCIRHAGGVTPDGTADTNALEAIDQSYADGDYFLELDFSWTSDDEMVCIHDWHSRFSESIRDGSPLTLAEFEEIKIFGTYQVMTLPSLTLWLEEHPEVRIVTDIKYRSVQGLAKIAGEYPHLIDRFIPQIYSFDEYGPVREQGYRDIILTLYAMSYEDKTNCPLLVDFALEHPLFAFTFDKTLANVRYVAGLMDAGIRLYTHTVNDADEIKDQLAMGITGVYSDYHQTDI